MSAPHPPGRRSLRLRRLVAAAAFAVVASGSLGSSAPPAGAWGTVIIPQCNTLAISASYQGTDTAQTRNRDGACGPTQRWRGWGFYGEWEVGSSTVVSRSVPHWLYGGADHAACIFCTIHST